MCKKNDTMNLCKISIKKLIKRRKLTIKNQVYNLFRTNK